MEEPTYEVHGEGPPVVQLPLRERAECSRACAEICRCGSGTNQRLVGGQHAAVALVSSDGNQRHGAELLLGDVRGGVAAENRRNRIVVLEKTPGGKNPQQSRDKAVWSEGAMGGTTTLT